MGAKSDAASSRPDPTKLVRWSISSKNDQPAGEGEPTPTEIDPEPTNLIIDQPLIHMRGVQVKYGEKTVLGDWQQDVDGQTKNGLWWSLKRGERWGVFGPNGM